MKDDKKMAWEKMAVTGELPVGSLIEVERDGAFYALCNVAGEIRAIGGTCPHHGGPLGEGALNGNLVTCPWHMWEFDSATGRCAFNEAVAVPAYPVRVENGEVLVDLA